MKIEYLRTSRKSYMLVKDADYIFEGYELQMIFHNDIPGLLDFQVIVGDGTVEYWYDVTGMQSLEKQFSVTPIGEKQLRFFLQNLIGIKISMEEYLLDDQNLSFLSSMIYYDRFSERIRFCYIPGLAVQKTAGLRELFGEMLQHLDHSDTGAVRMGYEMYERCMQSEFLVEDCIECLTNRGEGKHAWDLPISSVMAETCLDGSRGVDPIERSPLYGGENTDDMRYVRDKEYINDRRPDLSEANGRTSDPPIQSEEKPRGIWRKKRKKRKKQAISYSDVLDAEQRNFYAAEEIQTRDYTEYFSEEDLETSWSLIYKGDGVEQDFVLSVFPFFVGTDYPKVQGCMQARTISRVHAKLFLEEGKLFLEDYNSTNGTYVNHKLLPMNTPVELQPGDRVVFATEEFMVSCIKVPR